MSKRVSRACKWCGHKVTFDVEKHDKHIYNKALDDFAEKIIQRYHELPTTLGYTEEIVKEMAEKLKAGVKNVQKK